MGLAASQARFLMLTARKADCEYGISIDAMHKMQLSREMTELAQEYNSKLKSKDITYYANGQNNKISYQYLMGGSPANTMAYLTDPKLQNTIAGLKECNSLILTDYKGQVVLSQAYADAISKVTGVVPDAYGRGATFDTSLIPKILEELLGPTNAGYNTTWEEAIEGAKAEYICTGDEYTTLDNNSNGQKGSGKLESDLYVRAAAFYYPIFAAAASNGWTTEYNSQINDINNQDYVSDSIVSGTFNLATVDANGEYNEHDSLTYFMTAGYVSMTANADYREELTAWYEAEKATIAEKEDWLDIHIENLSMELEAIKTEMDSVKSFIDDATSSIFDWGSG